MRLMTLFALSIAAGCGTPTTTERLGLPELQTVERVELDQYLGNWFEIASFPQDVQKGCTGTNTTYSLRDDGEIDVLNRCIKDGKEDIANGRARVEDTVTNAKLKISFFGPFYGDYWVIELGDDGAGGYSYAVVGHPSRDYLWVLSREATLDDEIYSGIITRLQEVGYETDRLALTLPPAL
jgi:apolipoprotein D and lipocalin family protein